MNIKKLLLMKILKRAVLLNRWLSSPLLKIEKDIDTEFVDLVNSLSISAKQILELGGVSRPVLQKSDNYRYIGIDIDDNFNHEQFYDFFYCQSVECEIPVMADLIFSKYLMEHVKDVEMSYINQISALMDNGKIVHLYPLGYHPFSLLNRLIGNKMARFIIPIIRPGVQGITGYPAYYSLGSAYSLENFLKQREGVKVECKYYYGAVDYFSFFFPFALLISVFNFFVRTFSIKLFASNVIVVITKV